MTYLCPLVYTLDSSCSFSISAVPSERNMGDDWKPPYRDIIWERLVERLLDTLNNKNKAKNQLSLAWHVENHTTNRKLTEHYGEVRKKISCVWQVWVNVMIDLLYSQCHISVGAARDSCWCRVSLVWQRWQPNRSDNLKVVTTWKRWQHSSLCTDERRNTRQ